MQLEELDHPGLTIRPGFMLSPSALKSPAISSIPPTPAATMSPTTPKGLPATLPQLPPGLSPIPQSPTSTAEHQTKPTTDATKPSVPPSSFSVPATVPVTNADNDYFSLKGRKPSASPTTPDDFGSFGSSGGTGFMSKLMPWKKKAVESVGVAEAPQEKVGHYVNHASSYLINECRKVLRHRSRPRHLYKSYSPLRSLRLRRGTHLLFNLLQVLVSLYPTTTAHRYIVRSYRTRTMLSWRVSFRVGLRSVFWRTKYLRTPMLLTPTK
jgi:hypothetical protein